MANCDVETVGRNPERLERMLISAATHIGRVREMNEDLYCVWEMPVEGYMFLAVADGMGGHKAGEVASSLAVDVVKNRLGEVFIQPSLDKGEILREAIALANASIYDLSRERPEMAGMGTTITAAITGPGNLWVAHVGDSRAYLINGGSVRVLTEDHSLVGQMLKNGNLTEEEAVQHPQKHVLTRALGVEEEVQVDLSQWAVGAGDVLVLATDGLVNSIKPAELVEILQDPPGGFDGVAEYLVNLANDRGGKDNATVVVARL